MHRRSPSRARPTWGLACAALLLLTACVNRSDSMPPAVTITEPRSGTVRSSENLRISGYAMDDMGVASIRVDGADLLADPLYATERGKRLVQFAFSKPDLRDGELTLILEVTDVSGRTTSERYVLTLDATPPTVELTSVTSLGGGKLRVEGIARDNMRLSSIRINGVPLAFTPSPEYAFSVDVDALEGGQVVVEDSAGNVTARDLR